MDSGLAFFLLLLLGLVGRTIGGGPSGSASTRCRSSSSSGSNVQQQILNVLAFERLFEHVGVPAHDGREVQWHAYLCE